jgi:uncharacterized membrane protein YidH (DUF202 family)
MIQENAEKKTSNKTLTYMLFVFGLVLIVVGIYLCTYSTVVMVNESISIYGITMNIPQPKQIQPYLPIGIALIITAIILIVVALFKTKG